MVYKCIEFRKIENAYFGVSGSGKTPTKQKKRLSFGDSLFFILNY
jgi:hypothetical protein